MWRMNEMEGVFGMRFCLHSTKTIKPLPFVILHISKRSISHDDIRIRTRAKVVELVLLKLTSLLSFIGSIMQRHMVLAALFLINWNRCKAGDQGSSQRIPSRLSMKRMNMGNSRLEIILIPSTSFQLIMVFNNQKWIDTYVRHFIYI